MAHNLDTNDGQTSFVTAREDAWHSLGKTLDHSFTAEEAMEHGLLGGWNVRKLPLFTVTENGEQIDLPNMNAVVRNNPVTKDQIDVLSRHGVSDGYHVIQNEEHAALLNALVDESGAHFETAGAIDGGRKVFVTMKLPGHIAVGGVDNVDQYIAAINSHDGSMSFTLMVTPVRIVCQNTLNLAFDQKSHQFRIRHTSGAEKLIRTQAREALDVSFKYLEGFQKQAEQLINTKMTQNRFDEIIKEAFGVPDDSAPAVISRAENKLDDMSELFNDAWTQEGIRETAWAGLNALTEWYDHFSPVRGDDRDTSRAVKALLDPSFKNQALQLMLQG